MREDASPNTQLFRYLLGDVSPEEAEQIEEAYFLDAALRQELWDTFDEIAERFLASDLPPVTAQKFAARLQSSPFLRTRVEAHYSLLQALEAKYPPSPQPVLQTRMPKQAGTWNWLTFRWGLVTAGVIGLVIGGYWMLLPGSKNPVTPSVAQSSVPPFTPTPVASPSQTPGTAPNPSPASTSMPRPTARELPAPVVATFFLLREAVRDQDEATPLLVPKQTQEVALQIELRPPLYPRYRVKIQTAAGESFSTYDHLIPQKQRDRVFLKVSLPADKLNATVYTVSITGLRAGQPSPTSDLRTFRIEKK